jgi:hypothetical protein
MDTTTVATWAYSGAKPPASIGRTATNGTLRSRASSIDPESSKDGTVAEIHDAVIYRHRQQRQAAGQIRQYRALAFSGSGNG